MGAVGDLDGDHPERPEIRLIDGSLSSELLGGHVRPRSGSPWIDRHARLVKQSAEAEVDDHRSRPIPAAQDNVFGLYVAMNDLAGVQNLEAAGNPADEFSELVVIRHSAGVDVAANVAAVDELAHQVAVTRPVARYEILAMAVNVYDEGRLHALQGGYLALKALGLGLFDDDLEGLDIRPFLKAPALSASTRLADWCHGIERA